MFSNQARLIENMLVWKSSVDINIQFPDPHKDYARELSSVLMSSSKGADSNADYSLTLKELEDYCDDLVDVTMY